MFRLLKKKQSDAEDPIKRIDSVCNVLQDILKEFAVHQVHLGPPAYRWPLTYSSAEI